MSNKNSISVQTIEPGRKELMRAIEQGEEDIQKGRLYDMEEFERNMQHYQDALDNDTLLLDFLKKLNKLIRGEKRTTINTELLIHCNYMKKNYNCTPTFNYIIKTLRTNKDKKESVLTQIRTHYKAELLKFQKNCIEKLSDDVFELYKGISLITFTVTINLNKNGINDTTTYTLYFHCSTPEALEVYTKKL